MDEYWQKNVICREVEEMCGRNKKKIEFVDDS